MTFGVYRTSQADKVTCETCTESILKEESKVLGSPLVDTERVLCKDCYMQYLHAALMETKAYTRGSDIW
jgi:formylmethanofuran dehydrogenase subunit E